MFVEYAKERRVTPPNREGPDLVRGENTNSGCVTKAAGIIYASVQEATVKSRVYSKRKGRRRKRGKYVLSGRPEYWHSSFPSCEPLESSLPCLLFAKIALRKSAVRVRKTNGFEQESIARILVQANIHLAKSDL